jgi:hypothetical protein
MLLASSAAESLAGDNAKPKPKPKPSYQVVFPVALDVQVGSTEVLELAVIPVDGFRVDLHGPVRITFQSGEEPRVAIKKPRLSRKDALDSQSEAPRFRVPLRGIRAGQERVSIRYRFWLCRSKICRPVRGKAVLTALVKEAPPPPVAP